MIDLDKYYVVAMADYIGRGRDRYNFLKEIPIY